MDKIILIYDCYNHRFKKDIIGTVVPQFSRMDIHSNGTKLVEISDENNESDNEPNTNSNSR